jgi:flagellar motility protein MotE (MotC chaperone)
MVYKFHLPAGRTTHQRLKDLKGSLISVAGLVGRKIENQDGQGLGTIYDVVFRWDGKEDYPPLTGIIVKLSWRKVWIPASNISRLSPEGITLNDANLDLREFKPRKGEVRLYREVLDHQLIDVNGARVVRASDLYLANTNDETRLVGVDVGFRPLLRRLGPSKFRKVAVPDSVIDWSTIQSFGSGEGGSPLRLSANRGELRKMRPGELADLLEDLGRTERRELLNALTPDLAADALEEMEAKELSSLIRESSPEEGAMYLSKMESDEAADALRDLDEELRQEILSIMPKDKARQLKRVLNYNEATAGGIMTTAILALNQNITVGEVKTKLRRMENDLMSLSAVAIVDQDGKLLYDLGLSNLVTATDDTTLKQLMKPPATVTVKPEASLDEVVELLIEGRNPSIVVTDDYEKPLGRILADDLLDVLVPNEKTHFPRLLSS